MTREAPLDTHLIFIILSRSISLTIVNIAVLERVYGQTL